MVKETTYIYKLNSRLKYVELANNKHIEPLQRLLTLPNKNISLTDHMTYKGNLDLSNQPIDTLPEYITIEGDLNICNTNIKKLPKTLKITGKLFYTKLKYIPVKFKDKAVKL